MKYLLCEEYFYDCAAVLIDFETFLELNGALGQLQTFVEVAYVDIVQDFTSCF